MGVEPKSKFIDTGYNEASIHSEILPAVNALRARGIETIASHSGIGQIGTERAWGSYIQIRLFDDDGPQVASRINDFAQALTQRLQQDLGNPELALQLVSAEQWRKDRTTTSMETDLPIYRLQLVGQRTDDEIRQVWKAVAEEFPHFSLQVSP